MADVIPSFKSDPIRQSAVCAAGCARPRLLAWPVIIRGSVAPSEKVQITSRHETFHGYANVDPRIFAAVRWRANIRRLLGITRGTRRLMTYYYQPREGIGMKL